MSIVPSVETGTLALLFLEILWVFVSDDPFKETTVQVKNAVETLWTHKYSIQDGNASWARVTSSGRHSFGSVFRRKGHLGRYHGITH